MSKRKDRERAREGKLFRDGRLVSKEELLKIVPHRPADLIKLEQAIATVMGRTGIPKLGPKLRVE